MPSKKPSFDDSMKRHLGFTSLVSSIFHICLPEDIENTNIEAYLQKRPLKKHCGRRRKYNKPQINWSVLCP